MFYGDDVAVTQVRDDVDLGHDAKSGGCETRSDWECFFKIDMIALAVTGMREIMGDRFLGFWLKQFSKG